MRERKLECSWSCGVDIGGLSDDIQREIQEKGLRQWLQHPDPIIAKPGITINTKSKSYSIAQKFLKVAKTNKGIVTFDQAKQIHPSYFSDCSYYAKKLGAEVVTDRRKKLFKVTKYV
jgi:hypothetical protein